MVKKKDCFSPEETGEPFEHASGNDGSSDGAGGSIDPEHGAATEAAGISGSN